MDSAASAALKPSALDLLAALLTGRDPEGGAHWASALAENRHLFLLLTTSLAVLVGCGVALLVRRSSAPRAAAAAAQAPPRPLAVKPKDEPDPDDGRQRVIVFFGTQTGTAEGFAKVPTQTLLLCLLCLRSLLQTTARARRSARLLAPLAKIGFDGTFGRGCRRSPKRPRRGTTRLSSRWSIWYVAEASSLCRFSKFLAFVSSSVALGFRKITPLRMRNTRRSLRRRASHCSSWQRKNWGGVIKLINQAWRKYEFCFW
jgi:hypothetical protein